jgi:hypothetical protein
MAKRRDQALFNRLRAAGIRKRVAGAISELPGTGKKAPKPARDAIDNLRGLIGELEDRATGGPSRRKAAARKAASTRKRKAARRRSAAKKGARTRTRA